MIKGPLEDSELAEIIELLQRIESRRTDETFHIVIDSPETEMEIQDFLDKIARLKPKYERVLKVFDNPKE